MRFGCVRRRPRQAAGCPVPQKKLLTKTRGGETGSAGNVFLAERLHRVVSLLRGLRWLLCVLWFLAWCGVALWMHEVGVEPRTAATFRLKLPKMPSDAR